MAAVTAGPKRTRQTYTRYQTLELEKVGTGRKGRIKEDTRYQTLEIGQQEHTETGKAYSRS
jgi:hypothetical protein